MTGVQVDDTLYPGDEEFMRLRKRTAQAGQMEGEYGPTLGR